MPAGDSRADYLAEPGNEDVFRKVQGNAANHGVTDA